MYSLSHTRPNGLKKTRCLKKIKFWPFVKKKKPKKQNETTSRTHTSCFLTLSALQRIDAYFVLRCTSRRARSSSRRKPGQVGILTHREAKWIILILLEGSALHTAIERRAAPAFLCLAGTAGFTLDCVAVASSPPLTPSAELISKFDAVRSHVDDVTMGVLFVRWQTAEAKPARADAWVALHVAIAFSSLLSLIQLSRPRALPDDSVCTGFIQR